MKKKNKKKQKTNKKQTKNKKTKKNRIWFSVDCILIVNDTVHHNSQDVLRDWYTA